MRVTAVVKFCRIAGVGVGANLVLRVRVKMKDCAGVGAGANINPLVRGGCEQVKLHPRQAMPCANSQVSVK